LCSVQMQPRVRKLSTGLGRLRVIVDPFSFSIGRSVQTSKSQI